MSLGMAILFFASTLGCLSLAVGGVYYYLRTRNDALTRRIEELQDASGGDSGPRGRGDFWDFLLESTYGLVFGKSWFRQKEMEMVRAGIRGTGAVKVYGVL